MSNSTPRAAMPPLPPLPGPDVRDLSGQFYVGWSREQVEQIRRETVQACAAMNRKWAKPWDGTADAMADELLALLPVKEPKE